MKKTSRYYFLLLLLLATVPGLGATCHVVTSSGSGSHSGADWNNAFAGLPGSLTRGDTYYLADGSYGSYIFNTSGSTAITILKATASDNCTNTGWNLATMGSGRATFTQWNEGGSSGGHYTLNGVIGTFNNSSLPTAGSFGIFLDGSACHSGSLGRCVELDGQENQNFQSVTFSYVEIQGTGATSSANSNTPDDLVYYGGSNGLTLDHIFLHDSSCDFTFGYGSTNLTVQYSYFYKNWGAGSCHGQVSWNGSTHTNPVWRYNTFRTIEGTAIITAATAGGGTSLSGLKMYGNTFYWGGSGDKASYQCLGNGLISCVNSGVACSNITFYNNTIVGFPADNSNGGPASCGASGAGFYDDGSATWTGLIEQNNIWYGNNTSSRAGSHIGGVTEDHNSYLNNPDSGSGTADVVNGNAQNPFVSWTGNGDLNANLTADSSDVNNWLSLPSPFDIDPNGTTRSTDRGAYQYGGGTSQGPQPPTELVAAVH
jgi:hypothetical protein